MPEISLIISTYNGLDKLKLSLSAYKNQTLSDYEVIVACDGSSDGTKEFIREAIDEKKYPYRLRAVWHEDDKYRLARIRNCAWRIAEANRVVFTDQDIVPNHDCLANYARFAQEEVALAGYIGWISEDVHMMFTEEKISQVTEFDPFMTETELRNLQKYNSWVLWGGNMSFTRKVFDETGGFDEEFQAWGGEDTDLGVRLDRIRYPIKTLAEAKMFHLNHAPNNSKHNAGSKLFYDVKRYDRTIVRNHGADYSDVEVID